MNPNDAQLKFLRSLIPGMERTVIETACEVEKLHQALNPTHPGDPVLTRLYVATLKLSRATESLLNTRAEIEELGQTGEIAP